MKDDRSLCPFYMYGFSQPVSFYCTEISYYVIDIRLPLNVAHIHLHSSKLIPAKGSLIGQTARKKVSRLTPGRSQSRSQLQPHQPSSNNACSSDVCPRDQCPGLNNVVGRIYPSDSKLCSLPDIFSNAGVVQRSELPKNRMMMYLYLYHVYSEVYSS